MQFRLPSYHGSRATAVLPGHVLYGYFPPVAAGLMNAALFAGVGVVALARIGHGVAGRYWFQHIMLLALVLNPVVLAAFARGYVDGPSLGLGLASIAAILAAERSPRSVFLLLAGAGITLSFCAHPFGGGMAGLTVATIWIAVCGSPRAFLRGGLLMALGAALALLALALASAAIGLPFNFLALTIPALTSALTALANLPSPFLLPLNEWAPAATRLLMFPSAILLLVVGGVASRNTWRDPATRALAVAALVPIAVMALTLLDSSFFFQFAYYAIYLWLGLVPAMVLYLRRIEHLGAAGDATLAAALAACIVLPLLIGSALPLGLRDGTTFLVLAWLLLALLFGGFIMAALGRRERLAALLLALLIGFSGSLNRDTATVFRLADAPDLAAQQRSLDAFRAVLDAEGVTRTNYIVWIGRDRFTEVRRIPPETLYQLSYAGVVLRLNMLDSLIATLGWHAVAIGFNMPTLGPDAGRMLDTLNPTPRPLITLCATEADCEAGFTALEERGIFVARRPFHHIDERGSHPFLVGIADVSAPLR